MTEIFADVPYDQQPLHELTGRGPDDLSGCILAYQTVKGEVPRRLGYYKNEQSWTPVGDGSGLWIGVDTAESPKAAELQRTKLCLGYPVTLGDGAKWIVPVIRRHDPAKPTWLPCAYTRDSSGNQVETVRAAYREHWEAFREAAEWVYAGMPDDGLTQSALVDLAVRALSVNYRFDWNLQNVLQPIGTESLGTIICAAVDLPGFTEAREAQKKTRDQSATLNTTPGQPAESTTTPPVGATSI